MGVFFKTNTSFYFWLQASDIRRCSLKEKDNCLEDIRAKVDHLQGKLSFDMSFQIIYLFLALECKV